MDSRTELTRAQCWAINIMQGAAVALVLALIALGE